jgi:23S rRNA pseudouridine1911/1915/1917 synthase
VLDWLAARYRHSSEALWRSRLEAGELRLEGRVARGGERLRPGQWLTWRRPPWSEPEAPATCALLHRDEHLLAVAKPRGLPVLPGAGFLERTLLSVLRRLDPRAVPLHRLGRGTSGLVLAARTPDARRGGARAMRGGGVVKVYRTLVCGVPSRERFDVDVPIGPVPHPRLGRVHAASAGGRSAATRARVLGVRDGDAILEVRILTGRPHQIRIHMAAAGHPLRGDPLYAAGGGLAASPGLPGDPGYRLHAERLELEHPISGRRLVLECPPPASLRL